MFIKDLLNNEEFLKIIKKSSADILYFLLENNIEFSVLCAIEKTQFNPVLPSKIRQRFKPLTLFMIAGYSFESAYIEKKRKLFIFEAGFGNDNIGSIVHISLAGIYQIVIGDEVIFINQGARLEYKKHKYDNGSLEHSAQIFLSNPDNSFLFRD